MSDEETTSAPDQTPDDIFLTAVIFESALGALALFLGWLVGPSARELVPEINLAWFASPIDWESLRPIGVGLGYGVVAAVPMLVAIELLRRIPWEPIRNLERLSDDGVIRSLLELRTSEMIVISLCAGIGEELLFRGWLMYWIADGWSVFEADPVSPAFALGSGLVISSIAFGLVHPLTKLYIVVAAVMGLYFGGLCIWTGNLLVPITAHAVYDAVQLVMTKRAVDPLQIAK